MREDCPTLEHRHLAKKKKLRTYSDGQVSDQHSRESNPPKKVCIAEHEGPNAREECTTVVNRRTKQSSPSVIWCLLTSGHLRHVSNGMRYCACFVICRKRCRCPFDLFVGKRVLIAERTHEAPRNTLILLLSLPKRLFAGSEGSVTRFRAVRWQML